MKFSVVTIGYGEAPQLTYESAVTGVVFQYVRCILQHLTKWIPNWILQAAVVRLGSWNLLKYCRTQHFLCSAALLLTHLGKNDE